MKRLLLIATLFVTALPLLAQEATPKPPAPPRHYYKLTYVLKELDEGKVVNQRSFVLTTATGERPESHMRAGSRIPLRDTGDTKFIDVGVNLDTTIQDAADGLVIQITAEISSAGEGTPAGSTPVIRQIRTNGLATIQPNKPTLVFEIDDPASRHQFQLEVTAVPQK